MKGEEVVEEDVQTDGKMHGAVAGAFHFGTPDKSKPSDSMAASGSLLAPGVCTCANITSKKSIV